MKPGGDASATASDESTTPSAHDRPGLTPLDCVQILEVRGGGDEPEVTITAAIAADAIGALCTALSEQLDRHAQIRSENAEDVLRLREHSVLVERFQPLAAAAGHAVVSFSRAELHTCLVELTHYVERLDDEHYQAPDLRARLQIIDRVTPVLWKANAAAAATSEKPRGHQVP